MSILKYFKRTDSKVRPSASILPDPTGPLSLSISTGTIALANERVADVIDTGFCPEIPEWWPKVNIN